MTDYKPPEIDDSGNGNGIEPRACNVCLVGGVVGAVWNLGAVWNVALVVAYAAGALVVVKGLGPSC